MKHGVDDLLAARDRLAVDRAVEQIEGGAAGIQQLYAALGLELPAPVRESAHEVKSTVIEIVARFRLYRDKTPETEYGRPSDRDVLFERRERLTQLQETLERRLAAHKLGLQHQLSERLRAPQ